MKLINGLLDYAKPWTLPDIYLFTGNPIITTRNKLVMGRGAAKAVRDTYPGIDTQFAETLSRHPDAHLIWRTIQSEQLLGWFKVKDHWNAPAKSSLIKASTKILTTVANNKPEFTLHMNYPGIGNGKLTEEDVSPILEILPDNVLIYK